MEQTLKEIGIMMIVAVGVVLAFGVHHFFEIWLPRKYGQRKS